MEFNSEFTYYIALAAWVIWVLSMIDALTHLYTEKFIDKMDISSVIGISAVYIFILAFLWIEELYYNFKNFKYWKWAYFNQTAAFVFELVVVFLIAFMFIGYFIWLR